MRGQRLMEHSPSAKQLHAFSLDTRSSAILFWRLIFLNVLQASLIRHQFRIILVPGRTDEALAEHREILIYLEQHDAVGAEQAMRHHMAQLCRS